MKRLLTTLVRMLAWFGRPFAPYQYQMPDGVLFGPDGRTWTDTSEYRPANRAPADSYQSSTYQPKRMPAAPAGYRFITGRDQLTGWPYYQLKRNEEES